MLQWDSIWLEGEADSWRFSLWYQLHPSTQAVLWKIRFKYCIFWGKQIGPFALGAFINLIHGMRNSLWNGSTFEFHVTFSARASMQLLNFHSPLFLSMTPSQDSAPGFRNLSVSNAVLQNIENQTFFPSVRNEYYTMNSRAQWDRPSQPEELLPMPALARHLRLRLP